MRCPALLILASLWMSSEASAQTSPVPVFERDAVEVSAPKDVTIERVSVDNRYGNVTVRGHDKDTIAVQSFKRAPDAETLERLVVSLVPNSKGQVDVATRIEVGGEGRPVQAGSLRVDLIVLVPRSAFVDATIWRGELELIGAKSGAKLEADRGRIAVANSSGGLSAFVREGRQDWSEVTGELSLRALEGELRVDGAKGRSLKAAFTRGRFYGSSIEVDELVATSIFGDIEVQARPFAGGSMRLVSKRGRVEVHLIGDAALALLVRAKKAEIGAEMAPRLVEGTWRGIWGDSSKAQPAHLELRAETSTVTVRHF